MIAAIRAVNARRLFEFGTFFGSNTLNMALNTPADAEIFTLDLDEQCVAAVEQVAPDAILTQMRFASESRLDFADSEASSKIKILTGNSRNFDLSPWKGSTDFIFIDGGHDLFTVKSDTENALEMAAQNKPSCIMWHDYGNAEYGDLTGYLDQLSGRLEILHIGDTMLCIWFNDKSVSSGLLPSKTLSPL